MPDPDDPMPPYAFVPGGPFPHPTGSAEGHSAGRGEVRPPAIAGDAWRESAAYLRGFDLFNAGYYWEAHESWEGLWHAHGRTGPIADLLKGLIKLAAAGVKVRQGQPHGVFTHATRAAEAFRRAEEAGGRHRLGMDLVAMRDLALRIAATRPTTTLPATDPVARVFGFAIYPGDALAVPPRGL